MHLFDTCVFVNALKMEKVSIVLLILYISSLNCFAEKTDISTKDESNFQNKNNSTNTKDKRDKRQTYRDILTLYGGWKPILPGSPYHFGSQIFNKEDGRNSEFSSSEHSESLILEPNLFYFDAPNYEQPKKNIYAYYPPPIISSNYNKHLQPKPLYKEKYRNPMQNIQPFQISDLQTFTLKDPKQVEVLNLEVSVLPINEEGDKNYKGSHKIPEIQLATVPIAPEIIGDKPLERHPPPPPHRQPPIPIKNSDIIIPTIPINSEPIENIPQLPVFHSHVQNHQRHHQKQEELAITVFSNINQGDKSLHVPKEEIKVVPVELGEDILQPAAIVDEVVELKEVPLQLDGAHEKHYASSERDTSVSYVSSNKNSLGKQVIFPSSSNRKQAALTNLKFRDKKEELVSLNLKPGETVKDALIQFAIDPKKSAANHKVADEPFETIEIVEIPKTDYIFSKRSGKSMDKKEVKIKEKLKSSL